MREDRERSTLHHFVPTHLRGTRRSWAFLVVAALAALAIVEGARTVGRVHDAVVPGVFFSLRAYVMAPVPGPARAAGIGLADRIVAVDGRSVDQPYAVAEHVQTLGVGHRVQVSFVDRDGAAHTAELETFAPSWATAWLRFAVGVTFALVGMAVFWFHPGRRESWPFLFGCVAWGITSLTALGEPRTTQSVLAGRISLAAFALVGPMFLHLFVVFPRPLRAIVRRAWLLVVIDGFGILAAAACTVLRANRTLFAAIALIATINSLVLIAVFAIVVWRVRRPAPPEDAARMRALIVAVAVAFPVPTVLVLARVLGYVPATDAPKWASDVTSVMFPLLVGHAILRRDLFEIDRAVARAAAASALVGLVALVVMGIAFAVPALVAPDSVVGSPVAMAIVVLGAAAMLWPVGRRVQHALLARFDRPDLDDRLAAVREALAELAESAEPALFGRFERRLEEAVDVADAALLLPDTAGWRRPATGERVPGAEAPPQLVELRLRDELIGALGFGRPRVRLALSASARRIAGVLAPEVARALHGRPSADKLGGYQIERFVAAGGMGSVYVGAKVGAGGFVKEVAIKQLLPELAVDPAVVERFLAEARLVARLSHPGIVQTLELGETERGYFIVMEYVHGVDAATLLRRLKRRGERLPLAVAAHITTSICLALDHVHRARDDAGAPLALVHHDVSPHNVLIDLEGNPKLADFGVARMRRDASPSGQLVGKIGYVSPEQVAGEPYDHRIDVFAAGIVLYELVTMQHPFAHGSEAATLRAIEHGRYLPPETLREDCPDALAQVIARALAPVARRYATAAELAEAVQRVYPLDSRHAAELGRLVRSVHVLDPHASGHLPVATASLPTMR